MLRLVPPTERQVAPNSARFADVARKIETVARCALSVIVWSLVGFAITLVW